VGKMKSAILMGLLTAGLVGTPLIQGQLPEPGSASTAPNPLSDTTVKPGKMILFDLAELLLRTGSQKTAWRSTMARLR